MCESKREKIIQALMEKSCAMAHSANVTAIELQKQGQKEMRGVSVLGHKNLHTASSTGLCAILNAPFPFNPFGGGP